MKDSIYRSGIALAIAIWAVVALAQVEFRGRYEVSVSWGSSASLITSSYEVIPGQTIEVPIGDDFVSITVLPLSDSEYDLQITQLNKEPGPARATTAFTRRESFGARSELKDTASGVSVPDGATVTVLKLWEE